MVLRISETVGDRKPLDDEPFKSCFEAQSLEGDPLPNRHTGARPSLYVNIEKAMREEPNGLDAARAWLRTVFLKEPEPDLNSKDLDVFVQFNWLMFRVGQYAHRDLHDLLVKEGKARGHTDCCSLGAGIIVEPLKPAARRPVPVKDMIARVTKRKRTTPKGWNPFQQVKLRGKPKASQQQSRDSQVLPPAKITRLARTTGVPGSSGSASSKSSRDSTLPSRGGASRQFHACGSRDIHDTTPSSLRKKRGQKRRADKFPSQSSSDGSADEGLHPIAVRRTANPESRPVSPLTPLSSDCEDESLIRAEVQSATPTLPTYPHIPRDSAEATSSRKGVREVPRRKAANRSQLQSLVLDMNEYEEKLKDRDIVTDIDISSALMRKSALTASISMAMPRKRLEISSKRRERKPKGPTLASSMDGGPGKKRRGNDGEPVLDYEPDQKTNKTAKAKETRRDRASSRVRRHSSAVVVARVNIGHAERQSAARPPTMDPCSLAAQDVNMPPKRKGRKRQREDTISTPTPPEELPKASAEEQRLIIRIPSRSTRIALASAPPCTTGANGLQFADDMLCDAGANGLMLLRNDEEQASEWEHDPDGQQPGDSSDEEQEPSKETAKSKSRPKKGRLTKGDAAREDVASASTRKRRGRPPKTLPVLPTAAPPLGISVDYAEQEGSEMVLSEHGSIQHDDPRLTLCPLFDDPLELQTGRSELPELPPIWAESRQEVCESFDWFRSYQGGVYFVKGIVKGYLLSAFSANRDLFYRDGKLIISHGGGKAAQSLAKAPGTVIASDQQEDDKSVRALLHNYRTQRPLVLIIDDKYTLFPFDLASKKCTYAILGWYQIAYAWAEYQPDPSSASGCVVRYKFAFQWCEAQGTPWWSTSTESSQMFAMPSVPQDDADDKPGQDCTHCSQWSPQVYEEGWMCLKPRCPAFWHLLDAEEMPTSLNYSAPFLRPVKLETDQVLETLSPPLPAAPNTPDRITTSRHFCKGWHCTKCGRLSSRYKWEHWECKNCGSTFAVPGRLRTANEFFSAPKGKSDTHKIGPQSGIGRSQHGIFQSGKAFGTRVTFVLPHGRGKIHALLSRPTMNGQANEILKQYQDQAATGSLKFRRWPLRSHKCRGTLLTNYFSQNTGEPYQYVGGTANTVSFDQAPTAVVGALDLIKTRIKEAGLGFDPNFNEVLTAAYMEEQKMAFHSDAERGLGPNVASLSLGAGAYMHFRLHAQFAAQEMQGGGSREVLTLFLRHGDVVVMEGADIQKYYEHTVVPLNFRIAATARYIGSEHHGS